MKHKFNSLKSALPALALSLVLSGGVTLPDTATENPENFPQQPSMEEEKPDWNDENGCQPLSDLDERVTKLEE